MFLRVAHRRLPPPPDPSPASSSDRPDPPREQPVPQILHAGGREQDTVSTEDVYLGVANDIMTSHIIFPVMPMGVEDWDIVRYSLQVTLLYFLLKSFSQHFTVIR